MVAGLFTISSIATASVQLELYKQKRPGSATPSIPFIFHPITSSAIGGLTQARKKNRRLSFFHAGSRGKKQVLRHACDPDDSSAEACINARWREKTGALTSVPSQNQPWYDGCCDNSTSAYCIHHLVFAAAEAQQGPPPILSPEKDFKVTGKAISAWDVSGLYASSC